MSGKAPLRRFLLLVLLPAVATCIGIARTADDTREERRDGVLSRTAGLLSTAVQTDLSEAWRMLEAEARPIAATDTMIAAVGRARSGDTVRALGTDPRGARASVLLPRGDTLVSATALIRSPIVDAVSESTPLDVALYLQGVRLQPPVRDAERPADPGDPRSTLPVTVDPTSGWSEASGLWIQPATASLGSASSDLVVALRPAARQRGSTSLRTVISASLLLLVSLGLAVSGAGGAGGSRIEREGLRGRMVAAVTLATLTTVVISISVALGAERRAVVDGARELEVLSGLVEARGMLDAPAAAERWLGSPVYSVRDGQVTGGSDTPVPAVVTELDPPEPGRPTTGEDELRWRAVATKGGYVVVLDEPIRVPPLLLLALGGSLITLLGAVVVARASAPQPLESHRRSAP